MIAVRKYFVWALAAFFIGLTAACAPTADRRATGEFVDDATLTTRVKAALLKAEGVKEAAAINVDTYRGVVSLAGFLDNEDMIRRSVAAARNVQGVREVQNKLSVKPSR